MKTSLLLLALLPVAALASDGYYYDNDRRSTSNEIRTDRYGTADVGEVRQVDSGIVVAVRQIAVTRTHTPTGSLVGAVAGGAIGNAVGNGRNRAAVTLVGALLGAVIGNRVEKNNTIQTGHELVIRLQNGRLISITQGPDRSIRTGDEVFIIYDEYGRSRVVRG